MAFNPYADAGTSAMSAGVREARALYSGLEVAICTEDIRQPTEWRIQDEWHTVIVHLDGRMSRLETEMDGFGGSCSETALPGEIWSIPAGRRYAGHARGRLIHYAVLRLNPEASDLPCGESGGVRNIRPTAGERDECLYHAVRQLGAALSSGDDVSAMLAESLAPRIRLHALRWLSPEADAGRRGPCQGLILNQRVSRLLRGHIHQRLSGRITVRELAGLAGLSSHQFFIAFRQTFGVTPGQYIIRQRLRRAQDLLLNTRHDITAIALESGFSSHSHLSATFKRQLGMCPTRLRAPRSWVGPDTSAAGAAASRPR